jgi:undecaprenyl-diphosphatase
VTNLNKSKKILLGGISCWLAFGVFLFSYLAHASWITALDQWGYHLLQPTTALRTSIYAVITRLGDPTTVFTITVLIGLLCWWRHRLATGGWYLGIQVIGYLLVIAVKYSVVRPRPTHQLVAARGYSFPSGHTFATTLFTLTIITLLWPHLHRRWQRVLLSVVGAVWILAVMSSRVYLRDHYSTDVLAGLLLAAGWWLLTSLIKPRVIK